MTHDHLSGLQIWWALMATLGLAVAVVGLRSPWRLAGMVAGVWLIGLSSQLALTQPLWFQSVQIRPASRMTLLFDAVIALQALAAGAVVLKNLGVGCIRRCLVDLGPARSILFLILSLAACVAVMSYVPGVNVWAYAIQLAASGAFLGVNLLTAMALAAACPQGGLDALSARVARLLSLPGSKGPSARLDRWIPWLAAGWVLAIAGLLTLLSFQGMPRIPDEAAYLFQARTYAHGFLWAPAPPAEAVKALQYDFMTVLGGKWFSIFPPGWPAVLALGVAVGAPWLVNPLLAALSVLAAHALLTRLASRGFANLAVLLLAASPWFLAMAASLSSHVLTLALVLSAWLLISAPRGPAALRCLLAGVLMGVLFLTRPLEGLTVGVLTGLWTMRRMDLRTLNGWAAVALYGLGCAAIGALIFPYNHALVGSPLLTPIDQYFNALWGPGSNRMGFGPDIGPPDTWGGLDIWRGHSPLEALIEAQYNVVSANVELFGWGVGSVALVLVHLLWGRWKALDLGMAAIVAITIGAYSLYWFNGGFYIGPRYWFMTLFPLVVLSASGALTLASRIARTQGLADAGARVGVVLTVLMLMGTGSFLSWRATTKYFEFRGFHADYRRLVATPGLGRDAVFVQGSNSDYASAFIYNDPLLPAGRPVFLRDLGAEANRKAAVALGGRPVRFIVGRQTGVDRAHFVPDQPSAPPDPAP